jgi:hypothetical protein
MMRCANHRLRVTLLLGALTGCPARGGDRASFDSGAAVPLASDGDPIVEEPTACVGQLTTQDAASDAQLLELIARCVRHSADFELRRVAVSDTEFVARAIDKAANFSALGSPKRAIDTSAWRLADRRSRAARRIAFARHEHVQ